MLPKILILYTGGTIGMDEPENLRSKRRRPLHLPELSPGQLGNRLRKHVPELDSLARCDIEIVLNRDSAHIGPDEWLLMAKRIREKWRQYDGIVVLHGTDTLAYSASALSFLLAPCLKPVVLTGAQRPLAALRTDARRNLISAVEIAAYGPREVVRQVSVFFDDRLLQGNRARKRSAFEFAAFESPKAPPLALVGTQIHYEERTPPPRRSRKLVLQPAFDRNVALVHVTPGFPAAVFEANILPSLSALVLIVFSSGTAPTNDPDFIRLLRTARKRRIPVVVTSEGTSQTSEDGNPSTYEAGTLLLKEGCTWAGEMTPECAYVKTSWILGILGQKNGRARFSELFRHNIADEGSC